MPVVPLKKNYYENKQHLSFKTMALVENSPVENEFKQAGIRADQVIVLTYRGTSDPIAIRQGASVRETVKAINQKVSQSQKGFIIDNKADGKEILCFTSLISVSSEKIKKTESQQDLMSDTVTHKQQPCLGYSSRIPTLQRSGNHASSLSNTRSESTISRSTRRRSSSGGSSLSLFKPIETYSLYQKTNEILLPARHPFVLEKQKDKIKVALSYRGYVRVKLTKEELIDILEKKSDVNSNAILGCKR